MRKGGGLASKVAAKQAHENEEKKKQQHQKHFENYEIAV